jgi:hypothetical protein
VPRGVISNVQYIYRTVLTGRQKNNNAVIITAHLCSHSEQSLLGDTLGTQDGCYPKADAAEVGLFSMSISGTIIIVYLIAADARGALIR